jgi:hypothetical protein
MPPSENSEHTNVVRLVFHTLRKRGLRAPKYGRITFYSREGLVGSLLNGDGGALMASEV